MLLLLLFLLLLFFLFFFLIIIIIIFIIIFINSIYLVAVVVVVVFIVIVITVFVGKLKCLALPWKVAFAEDNVPRIWLSLAGSSLKTYIRLIASVVVCACDHTHIFKQFLVLIVNKEDQCTLSYRNTTVQLQAGC